MAHAHFSGDFTKVTLAKQTKIEIVLPEGTSFAKIAEIARFRGERVNIVLGNPQVEMNFNNDELRTPRTGMKVTADASGFVQKVEGTPEEGNDLFNQEQPSDQADAEQGPDAEQDEADVAPEIDFENDEAYSEEQQDPDDSEDVEPGDSESEPESGEPEESGDPSGEDASGEEPSKEEVEAYILSEKPRFEDIGFNPDLYEYKKETGRTWMEVASENKMSSSELQRELGKYRKRIAAILKGKQGAA